MDLNHLLHRHQVSLMQADAATCVEARRSHGLRARHYAERIRSVQKETGGAAVVMEA